MRILALDTTGPALSVAVMDAGKIAAEGVVDAGLTHSQTLMPLLDSVLRAANLTLADIDKIACVAGPGSFTGVRIGVCAAKALCRAREIPAVRLDAMEVLAAGAPFFAGVVAPILDARRGQVYCAAFRNGERILDDRAMALTDFVKTLPPDADAYFTGDGVGAYEEMISRLLGARARFSPAHLRVLRAGAACSVAQAGRGEEMDGRLLTPIYLRQPQAERERLARAAQSRKETANA